MKTPRPRKTKKTAACSVENCPGCGTIRLFEKHLTHVKGELGGKPLLLERWQKEWLHALYGDRLPGGMRQYRTTLLAIPRGNAKSTTAAGVAIKGLLEPEPGAEVYGCAADKDQASLVREIARGMVNQSPFLSRHIKLYRDALVRRETGGVYRSLSADAFTKHGLNPHVVVFDELHAQKTRELHDVMATAMGKRSQPLMVYLTTAGYDRKSICWEVWKYAEAVAAGTITDETFLPAIYAAGPADDWKSEEVWAKANPNLHVSVKLDFLRRECAKAIELPTYENTFRQLYLNQWTEQDTRWLRMDHWAQGDKPCPVPLDGRDCWGGLDLASTFDTTALCLLFPLDGGMYWVEPHFWIPESNLRQRVKRDRVPYDLWEKQGRLHVTSGDVTDYDQVRADINRLAERYNIRQIAIDRWNATQLSVQLQGDGREIVGFGQGYASMSAPAKQLEGLVVAGKLLHGGHPVLAWQAGNVAVDSDYAGNIKPSKKKSTERIDGMVALTMALGIHSTAVNAPPVNWDIQFL